jgi:hypothetical protein
MSEGPVPLPDTFEVAVSKDSVNLALFWRRRDDDALGVLASRAQLKRPITVAHARAAAALLREIGEPGALRLAKRLEAVLVEQPMVVTWRHDELPSIIRPREGAKPCNYTIEPHTGLKCKNPGAFAVDGARGSFCELHARRTAVRVTQRPNPHVVRRRERKKNAGTPTSTT